MSVSSEYVRQELRAVVGARTGQMQQPAAQNPRPPTQLHNQQVNAADLESLGFTLEMPNSGKWYPVQNAYGPPQPPPPQQYCTFGYSCTVCNHGNTYGYSTCR